MQIIKIALALLCLIILGTRPMFGHTFNSDKLGFAADFPFQPTVGKAAASSVDKDGDVVSNAVIVTSKVPGIYVTMVTVDFYMKPSRLDATAALTRTRDDFLKGLGATVISSDPGISGGYRALFFKYDTADHSMAGNGVIVVVPHKKPQVYLVVTMHTPQASADNIAALKSFITSFHPR